MNSVVRRGLVAAGPLVLAALLAVSGPGSAGAEPRGPDVASWQHPGGVGIDWFAVRNSGHQFAMVKATEGLDYVNPFFIQDCLQMRVAGVARGAYHYARPELSPELQAAYYATMVLGINGPGDMPPVLDLENSGGLAPGALIDWTHRYLSTVRALTGRQPIIYTYPNFWKTAMANTISSPPTRCGSPTIGATRRPRCRAGGRPGLSGSTPTAGGFRVCPSVSISTCTAERRAISGVSPISGSAAASP